MNTQSRIVRSQEPLASRIDDDLVLFSARNGMYYGTQSIGQTIWGLLESEIQFSELCDRLQASYEVERDTCEREVEAFLLQLEQDGLINVR
ncbi:PqqD family protein [Halomonas sp. DQ26W]|uniref:PqqD family peptide modification chaperone n=1 Tax=Halomonas sp. DQ26W TaxID=2282311 RepID=UPI000DF862D6|nr:PqqD family peptide modification chaperone [Halomonas sp. DQ26W]RDB44394.1 PqqD family protein [Halomonas sp. DQ26W]